MTFHFSGCSQSRFAIALLVLLSTTLVSAARPVASAPDGVESEKANGDRQPRVVTAPSADQKPLDKSAPPSDICALEVEVLGNAPENESVEQRLWAMEDKLFGQRSTEGLFVRLRKIQSALQDKNGAYGPAKLTHPSEGTSAAPSTAPVATQATAPVKGVPSKADQLWEAHKLFDEKNYAGARKSLQAFIAKNPLEYNGYYLLGLTDLEEHDALPEYDQFAYNQFLKAFYLQPRSLDCKIVCEYVGNTARRLRVDPRCVAVPSFYKGSPQSLLNVGVNCFLRDDNANATDLFGFVVKYCPGAAASGHYNLGAMDERKGQLQPALKEYRAAQTACQDRNALYAAGMLKSDDVDLLSPALIARTIQLVEHKIKTGDKSWTGSEQAKGAQLSTRCTINRLSASDMSADIFDAGLRTDQ